MDRIGLFSPGVVPSGACVTLLLHTNSKLQKDLGSLTTKPTMVVAQYGCMLHHAIMQPLISLISSMNRNFKQELLIALLHLIISDHSPPAQSLFVEPDVAPCPSGESSERPMLHHHFILYMLVVYLKVASPLYHHNPYTPWDWNICRPIEPPGTTPGRNSRQSGLAVP